MQETKGAERMSDTRELTVEDFKEASDTVKEAIVHTDLIYSPYFSDLTGNNVYFKPENLQRTGAFKVRGAFYKVSKLDEGERARGIITASAGNHAQGVAYAASKFGAKAIVVMPTTTPLIKVERTKDYGAEVILAGDVYDESCEHAQQLALENGYTFIHPFDDLDILTGQGTIGIEILEELPDVDAILVPVGGGGLVAGIATVVKMLDPHVEIIAVEPSGAASLNASLAVGEPVKLPAISTIADGTAVQETGHEIFPYLKDNVDRVITIDDEELVVAFLDMVENHKLIVENSGLLSVAALKHLAPEGKNVVALLSGGNMDVITMSSVVQHGLVERDRIFTVSVLLPDKPGELVRVASIIAGLGGNVIRLDHNQFVSTNRNAAVELRVTIEAYGTDHKESIIKALDDEGLHAREIGVEL